MKARLIPHITEKSMLLTSENAYAFKVARQTSKGQLKKMVEEKYKVNVIKTRMMKMKGKPKIAGKKKRKIKLGDWKKGMVVLKAGQKIEGFGETNETEKKQKTK